MRCKILRRLVVDRCGDQAKVLAVHSNRVRSEAVAPVVGGGGQSTADGTVGDGEEEDDDEVVAL